MTEYKVKVYDDRTEWRNLEGKFHRENGPAIEHSDGYKSWWINGQRHRIDGPAIEGMMDIKNGILMGHIIPDQNIIINLNY